jgi:hypothetical protein
MGAFGALGSIHLKVPPYLLPAVPGAAASGIDVVASLLVGGTAGTELEMTGTGAVVDEAGIIAADVGLGMLLLQPLMINVQTNRTARGTTNLFIFSSSFNLLYFRLVCLAAVIT